ncbi:uncharacterized protein N7529_009899 [Penicillium soppii]|uniref:uncharacterized protein n=1 Tax=Penicillium soppii TaxID=69789 RepID=UPI00254664B5|nr:uncharacterized protein N7529_009899 [Penicillium soppii]KAJ5855955.1 hypothetical protein N7529_009899 [Penicillium soppii]
METKYGLGQVLTRALANNQKQNRRDEHRDHSRSHNGDRPWWCALCLRFNHSIEEHDESWHYDAHRRTYNLRLRGPYGWAVSFSGYGTPLTGSTLCDDRLSQGYQFGTDSFHAANVFQALQDRPHVCPACPDLGYGGQFCPYPWTPFMGISQSASSDGPIRNTPDVGDRPPRIHLGDGISILNTPDAGDTQPRIYTGDGFSDGNMANVDAGLGLSFDAGAPSHPTEDYRLLT